MNTRKGSNQTGLPRRGGFSQALLVSLCLLILATGIYLLLAERVTEPNLEREGMTSSAAPGTASKTTESPGTTGRSNSQPLSTRGTTPRISRRAPSSAQVRSHHKQSPATQAVPDGAAGLSTAAVARSAKTTASKPAVTNSPSATAELSASHGVFSPAPIARVPLQRMPAFSTLPKLDRSNKRPSPAPKSVESAPQPSEATPEDPSAAPTESHIEPGNSPPVKTSTDKRMLTSAKGEALAAIMVITGNAPVQPRPKTRSQVEASAIAQEIENKTYDLERVAPGEFNSDVRDLPQAPFTPRPYFELEEPRSGKQQPLSTGEALVAPNNVSAAPIPGPIQNFAGLGFSSSVTGGQAGAGWPPDTNGDVGPNHYIQAVNDAYAIYSKTGTLLASFTENSLWSGVGTTPCNGHNQGDAVVIYDQFGDRWILTNFAFSFSGSNPIGPYYQCFAVSKTGDPVTGGWWLYAVRMDTGAAGQPPVNALNDYPKFGNWNDGCLYMSANEFGNNATMFSGTSFASFSKGDMESGAPLTSALGFINNMSDPFTMIPSNISGAKLPASLPPAGTPNYFVSESQVDFKWEVREFTPGVNCGGGGSLGAAVNVNQSTYDFNFGNAIPQPPPANASNNLDSLGDRLLQKVQYRRVGSAESLWVVHTVKPTGGTTIVPQWAQINVTGGTVTTTPVQEQIYLPDTTLHRWMASIAADRLGNAAVGYSTSNATSPNFPSIAYSGRLVTDPLNNLSQTETQIIAGAGSQVNNCGGAPCHRWGDYTAMSVDPNDDCTFWYTNEYYDTQASGNSGHWQTRIGSFKFPSCTAQYQGFLDAAGCGIITGWAWDGNLPNTVINVDIFDGGTFVATIPANLFREDIVNAGIGNGFHGFSFTVPASLKDGQPHTIHAHFGGTNAELSNSPRGINCSNISPSYQGFHDGAGCNTISGWARNINDPDNPINVDIYDGSTLIATVPGVQFRPDLVAAGIGNGFYGFSFTVPASLKDGQLHPISVKFPGTNTNLGNTPRTIGCSGAPPVFQGFHDGADCNTINGWAWDTQDPDSPINVAVFADEQLVSTVLAIQFRQDLANAGIGNGYHAFSFNTPASLKNGQQHSILVRFSGSTTPLSNSPKNINCQP